MMNDTTPWSDEKVTRLNEHQKDGRFHAYACPGNYKVCENQRGLVATTEGWVCQCGKYKQTWTMRYWTYAEPTSETDSTPIYHTFSDDEIIEQYWEWWYERMCNKFGKDVVDQNYSKEDCIGDWATTHWAWESFH